MKSHFQRGNSRGLPKGLLKWIPVLVIIFASRLAAAHPMSNSLVLLRIQPDGVAVELQLPLRGLGLAFGDAVIENAGTRRGRVNPQFLEYLKKHVQVFSRDNRPWSVSVLGVGLRSVKRGPGHYDELAMVHLWLKPPAGTDTHNFTLKYDVIIHHLLSHSALVTIQQDWENGIYAENPVTAGVISVDMASHTIPPLEINLEDGGWWKGFRSMAGLGMHHIAEGIDHLLFLLVLLFAAPLLAESGRWAGYGGMRHSLLNLLKIVTAFTIGHSVTLLIGTFNWVSVPSQIVEILIAFSILVSAIHALRPIFAGRESYVAAGFGLIHGLAFAEILNGLNLGAGQMALSLFGFNIGIELGQLIIVALIMPWLIMLSQSSLYNGVRIAGALFSGIAAIAWMTERITETSNPVTALVGNLVQYAPWVILFLALLAVFSRIYRPQIQAEA